MKAVILGLIVCAASCANLPAALAADSAPAAANDAASAPEGAAPAPGPSEEEILAGRPADFGKFCLFAGAPPSDFGYTVIKKLKVGKQTYGSVKDVLPELVDRARSAGADTIVNYNGSQRFGFFPWKLVRPVVTGTAVKWNGPVPKDCAAAGGSTVEQVLRENKAPPR